MMKTAGIFLMFFSCFLLIGINYAGSDTDGRMTMKSFSVSAPRGWTVERTGDDRVIFRMEEPRSGEVTIAVAADPVSDPDVRDRAWRRLRSAAAFRNGLLHEGEDRVSDETWRTIVYADEVLGRRLRCAALFFQGDRTQCVIRFSCPENRFDAMLPYFNSVKESFAFAAGTRT